MAEGGLPEGRCVHGADAVHTQAPAHVPAISIVATASQIAANMSPLPERSTHQASSGKTTAPCTSSLPVKSGSTVSPATTQPVARSMTSRRSRRPCERTRGSPAAVIPNT
jgi:hypothetical protein